MVLGSALSNLEIEFIDGVQGKDVPDKALPSGPDQERMPDPVVGSWRALMNAVQESVNSTPDLWTSSLLIRSIESCEETCHQP